MDEDDSSTPRSASGRTKKKSALARLAANRKRKDEDSSESSESHARYPIDANVEIRDNGKEEDSDEGIEMTSGSYDQTRRVSATALDGLRHLNMENKDNEEDSDVPKGEKRVHDNNSSGDEVNAGRKISRSEDADSHGSQNSEDSDSESVMANMSELQQEYADRYADKSSKVSDSQEDALQRYKEQLRGLEQDEESQDERADSLGEIPQPSRSISLPAPSTFHNALNNSFQASILGSIDRNWSDINRSATFDAMSQRSFQSSSVLPQVSTKAARTRSYMYGNINSNSALLGQEELERYFPEHKVRVFVGTWNMCEMKNVPDCVDEFLLPDAAEYVQDIYVIGTQESSPNRKEWEIKLQETLGPQHVLFHSAVHGTLTLVIFIRRDLIWFCSVSEEDNVTTRPPANIKTKGAVAVSFTFFGTSFLFLTSHFTAHDGKAKERVADYNKICQSLTLPRLVQPSIYQKSGDATERFDCVFWCGDLNFRIERDGDHVKQTVDSITQQEFPDFEALLAHDELYNVRNDGLAFKDFQEGRITFKPTYKFDMGTDIYDTKKLRIPSYTDRVLFRCRKKSAISCVFYDAVMSQKESDHRPVYAMFEVNIRPGKDTIPLAGGQFNREVWLEANKRRSQRLSLGKSKNQRASTVCSMQ